MVKLTFRTIFVLVHLDDIFTILFDEKFFIFRYTIILSKIRIYIIRFFICMLLCFLLCVYESIKECYHLRPCAVAVGTEGVSACSAGDSVLHRPKYCIVIIAVSFYIGKRIAIYACLLLTCCSPQECNNLRSCAAFIRRECSITCTAGYFTAVFLIQFCISYMRCFPRIVLRE